MDIAPAWNEELVCILGHVAAAVVVVVAPRPSEAGKRVFVQDDDVSVAVVVVGRFRRRPFSSIKRRIKTSDLAIFDNVGGQTLVSEIVLKKKLNVPEMRLLVQVTEVDQT